MRRFRPTIELVFGSWTRHGWQRNSKRGARSSRSRARPAAHRRLSRTGCTSTVCNRNMPPKHASMGGIARDVLEALVASGSSGREIAAELGVSQATVRHWLLKHGLVTERAKRRPESAARSARTATETPRLTAPGMAAPCSGAEPRADGAVSSVVPKQSWRAPAAQGRARERGRRRVCLVRLCVQHRSTSFPSRRPERKGVPSLPQRRNAVDRRSQGGGGISASSCAPTAMRRSKLESLPSPGSCPADQSGVAQSRRGNSIWQMRSAVNREVVGSSPTPGVRAPLPR